MQTYSVHFSRKIKTQNKEKEEKIRQKRKRNKWLEHCALEKTGRMLSLPINKPKTPKKNKLKTFIQLKTKKKRKRR